LSPVLRQFRDETERLGRTPPEVVKRLFDAGFFRMWLPRSLGGYEAEPQTFFGVIEEISAVDGAMGWNLMNGAC
jgi:alkylation response protein AidB-like acyl-CoA dehydrogenase